MFIRDICLFAIGLTGVIALPNPQPGSGPSSPVSLRSNDDYEAKEACRLLRCAFPVYHPETKTCTCEPKVFIDPILTTSAITPEPTVDPSTCPTIKCTSTTHPVYNPRTGKCSCQPNFPDPSTCPNVRCAEGTKPVYHNDGKRCSCEPVNQVRETCSLRCGAGAAPVIDPITKQCICKVTNPIPPTCPLLNCLKRTHVVFHPETGKCTCDPDCPDLFCIATTIVTFNPITNVCSCEPIPGKRGIVGRETVKRTPTESRDLADRSLEVRSPATLHSRAPVGCQGIFCIAEQRPVFNATSGRCECEWIPGLEPGGPIESSKLARDIPPQYSCKDIFCISEKTPVFNATSGVCECEWIPGLEPTPVPHCRKFCEFGFVPEEKCECNPDPKIEKCKMFCEYGFVPGKCECLPAQS